MITTFRRDKQKWVAVKLRYRTAGAVVVLAAALASATLGYIGSLHDRLATVEEQRDTALSTAEQAAKRLDAQSEELSMTRAYYESQGEQTASCWSSTALLMGAANEWKERAQESWRANARLTERIEKLESSWLHQVGAEASE